MRPLFTHTPELTADVDERASQPNQGRELEDPFGRSSPGKPTPPAPAVRRFPFFTSALAALAVFAHLSPGLTSALQFDHDALARGQLWRLFTAHFTHFGASHLGWDLAVFVAFGAWVETTSRAAFLRIVLISAPAVSLALWAFQPDVRVYRGLSGIDSAFFAFVMAQLIQRAWSRRDRPLLTLGVVGLAGFAAKLAAELLGDTAIFVADAGFVSSPFAHAIGATSGLLLATVGAGRRRDAASPTGATAPPGA